MIPYSCMPDPYKGQFYNLSPFIYCIVPSGVRMSYALFQSFYFWYIVSIQQILDHLLKYNFFD